MAKQQRTILICDRCGIEHNSDPHLSLNVRLWSNGGFTNYEWKDLCMACSVQIEREFEGWVIGKA